MIASLFERGSFQVLERVIDFTAERHKTIAHNIANIDTPRFRPRHLSHDDFQATLREAVDQRRERNGGPQGHLEIENTDEIEFMQDRAVFTPQYETRNVLFHDQNNRSTEHLMRDLVTNQMQFNSAVNMMNKQFNMLEVAISERV